VLRRLEEGSRLPLDDEAYDAQSDHLSAQHSRVASPSIVSESPESEQPYPPSPNPCIRFDHVRDLDPETTVSFSLVKVGGRSESVLVWEDEQDASNLSDEDRDKKEGWDEKLVVGSGWLYKQDIQLESLGKERQVVAMYLDVVDGVLFGGPNGGKRGWEKERDRVAKKMRTGKEAKANRRRASDGDGDPLAIDSIGRSDRRIISAGVLDAMKSLAITEEMEDAEIVSEGDSVEDCDLPNWAKSSCFAEEPLGRSSLHTHPSSIELHRLMP
jgi:hypothetical protein